MLEFAGLGSFAAVGTAGCVRGFGSGIKRGLAVITRVANPGHAEG